MWGNWNPHTLLVGIENGTGTVGKSLGSRKKLKIELPCDPAVPLLGICLREVVNTQRQKGD